MSGNDELIGQAQEQQQLLPPNKQSNITTAGKQGSAGLASAVSTMTGLSQTTIPILDGQGSDLSTMMEISQSSMNNSTGQVLSQNALLTNAQRLQLHARQQQQQQQQEDALQQQQTQAQQHLLYQQQLQQQQQALLQQKLQPQSNLQPSNFQQQQLQQHQQSVQQKQQQQQQSPMLQQSQPQSSQQSVVQPTQQSVLQSAQHSGLQQAASSVLQPLQQSVLQQSQQSAAHATAQFAIHQHQHSVLRQQQPQQVSVTQHQPSMVQQSTLRSQQQLMAQQNIQEQQYQLQQILQQAKASHHHQSQQASSSLLQLQSQQSQQQSQKHQQLVSQLQSQPQHLQQQPNANQQEMQQRLQTSGGLLQQHTLEQQKLQLQTQQQQPPEASSSSIDSSGQTGQPTVSDCQEKVYQKLQSLKETHFQEIKELYTRLAFKSQQPMVPDQLEKLKQYKSMLQRIVAYFQVPKCNIPSWFNEDKVHAFEKQVIDILNPSKQRKSALQQQQGQLLQSQISMQSVQQQSQPKISSVQQHDKHVLQPQQLNSLASMTSMQNSSMPLQKAAVPTLQPNTVQPGSDSNALQGAGVDALLQCSANAFQQNNNVNRYQQNNVGIIRHNGISTVQQNGINPLPHVGTNPSQQNNINTLQSKANALQQQRQVLKQQQDQQPQLVQAQQFKHQIRQCQMNHHMLQHQQQQQIQQQLQKQQQAAQLQAHLHPQKIPQVQLRNDGNREIKARQAAALKKALLQHCQLSQYSAYQQPHQQQEQQSSSLSVLSSQLLQTASPQISQQFSPQIDQQTLLTSSLQFSKVVTPLQPATSPSMAPPSSTHSIPSPLIEDVEKQPTSVVSSMSIAESAQGFQHSVGTSKNAQSLAVGTPGISASHFSDDFSPGPAQDIANQDGSQIISPELPARDKSTTVAPFECLAKTVNSMPVEVLNSTMNDVSSIVSLLDKIAGSAPGNGSKAAVGEDLVSMIKCRMQGRKFFSLDRSVATKKMKRCMSSIPLSTVTSGGSLTNNLQLNNLEFMKMQPAATSMIKRPRLKLDHVLQVEIQEVNQQLIETIVDISDNYINASAIEGRDGIVVKCTYNAITLSTNMKFKYTFNQMSTISPLWLFIPASYPECSPVVLDQVPVEPINEHEDLSSKTKSMFDKFVRDLPQPMSLGALARTWDACARNVLAEFARQSGGGSFSSQYGAWKNCVST